MMKPEAAFEFVLPSFLPKSVVTFISVHPIQINIADLKVTPRADHSPSYTTVIRYLFR